MRAGILAERGLVSMVDPQDLSAERLAQAIVQTLARTQTSADVLPGLTGVAKATSALLALLPSGNGCVAPPRKTVAPVSQPVWSFDRHVQSQPVKRRVPF
jgi:hypothetical protein